MDSQRKQPSKPYNIAYTFLFENRSPETIALRLARETLDLIEEKHSAPSAWVELEYCMCEDCPLDPATVKYCPVALNLSDVVERFQNFFAYENVHVTVTTEERTYSKETTVQTGLSSLIGIIMTTSGCPVLKYLKPMVRFHLPFASIEETIYRMTSMYLMAQYFLNQDGRETRCSLSGLEEIYSRVSKVNSSFAERLAQAAKKDANVNAIVNLDCFATFILDADAMLKGIRPFFTAYFQ